MLSICLYAVGQSKLSNYNRQAEALCRQLTLSEKISLLLDDSPAIPQLNIPAFQWWNEALHGVARNGVATVFPQTIGMAAAFDDELLQQVFTAVSDEARAKAERAKALGHVRRYQGLSFWTPNINIFRDPRWGRGQETYGEDPYLTGRMGLAVVRGLQGPDTASYYKTLACAKHFAVHSGPESLRHEMDIENLSPRDLWETYLPAFKSLVTKGQVAEVMCAYQRFDGQPCCGNSRLLQHILRDEWNFKGLVVSDCGAISDFWIPGRHGVARDAVEASAQAQRAGTDVECGSNYHSLEDAVKAGVLKESDIDHSVIRVLEARLALGDISPSAVVPWKTIPYAVVDCPAHRQLALRMAHESMVLLQNKHHTLPLSTHDKILVVGENAVDSMMLWANYNGIPSHTVTILDGIRQLAEHVEFMPGCGLLTNEVSESRMNQFCHGEGEQGMQASYWNNEDQEGEAVAQAVFTHSINQDNGGATTFAPGVNLTHFSACYAGILKVHQTEELLIKVSGDDMFRVSVNGKKVINKWRSRDNNQMAEYTLHAEAGKNYDIVVEYVQCKGNATFHFDVVHKQPFDLHQLIEKARQADVVVFVGGLSPRLEGEEMKVEFPGFSGGDRTSIELPVAQREAIQALSIARKPIVMVNCSGSAIALEPETKNCDAILQAWYPGEEGGRAVADVLFGKVNPSGKLPVTFYRHDDQLPPFNDYNMHGRTYRYFTGKPLFPFGYGLSYTTFRIGQPMCKGRTLKVKVSNTGLREGTETVQVYIKRNADSDGPVKSLCDFQKVSLKAGESKEVTFTLQDNAFECWDPLTNTMRVMSGKYTLYVGNSSSAKASCRMLWRTGL